MRLRQWFGPPHHLLFAFLAVTASMAAALGWLGWRLFDQDRALERERLREQLESAADIVGAALLRSLADMEDQLAAMAGVPDTQLNMAVSAAARELADDAALVVMTPAAVQIYPAGRLPFVPAVSSTAGPSSDLFARGEVLEFQQRDLPAAIAAYRGFGRSDDPAVRAGGFLRLARTLRKARQPAEALDVYTDLLELGATPIEGLPAALVARHSRCVLFDELGRRSELHAEAKALHTDLVEGRWPIGRTVYASSARSSGAGCLARLESAHRRSPRRT